jgi:hypothetical protein
MIPRIEWVISFFFLTYFLLTGCRRGRVDERQDIDNGFTIDSAISPVVSDTLSVIDILKGKMAFYGDTVWINPYGSQEWHSTITEKEYSATFSVKVDTTDYIIDTVTSKKGDRIVIGYNHSYNIKFNKGNKPWFTVSFDKKNDLKQVLQGTDYWLESNLDVFQNLVYNHKYKMFIVEYDINPRYNFGSIFYIVFNTDGAIQYVGVSSTWGGGGPDGESFLTQNEEMYITCFELYNFSKMTSISIPEYTIYSDVLKELVTSEISYKQVHAIRDLSDNVFLVVFTQKNGNPEYNALILNTDSIILDRFQYKGLMEEMDALFLFCPDTDKYRYFIYDTDREVLICIENQDSLVVKQIAESAMRELPEDTVLSENYSLLDFESFGSKIFYISDTDSAMFYSGGSIE